MKIENRFSSEPTLTNPLTIKSRPLKNTSIRVYSEMALIYIHNRGFTLLGCIHQKIYATHQYLQRDL